MRISFEKHAIIGLSLFVFSLPRLATADNDMFADRQLLVSTNINVTADTSLATSEAGEPLPAGVTSGHTLWYTWTAPFLGRAGISSGHAVSTAFLGFTLGLRLTNSNWLQQVRIV